MKPLLVEEDGRPIFLMEIEEKTEYYFNFSVYKVEGWYEDNTPSEEDVEQYLKASLRWDGCMNLWWGDEGYYHYCSVDELKQHCALVQALPLLAAQHIGMYDKDMAGWYDE